MLTVLVFMAVFYIDVFKSDFDIIIHLDKEDPWSMKNSQPGEILSKNDPL